MGLLWLFEQPLVCFAQLVVPLWAGSPIQYTITYRPFLQVSLWNSASCFWDDPISSTFPALHVCRSVLKLLSFVTFLVFLKGCSALASCQFSNNISTDVCNMRRRESRFHGPSAICRSSNWLGVSGHTRVNFVLPSLTYLPLRFLEFVSRWLNRRFHVLLLAAFAVR